MDHLKSVPWAVDLERFNYIYTYMHIYSIQFDTLFQTQNVGSYINWPITGSTKINVNKVRVIV